MPRRGTGSYPRRGISVRTRRGWAPGANWPQALAVLVARGLSACGGSEPAPAAEPAIEQPAVAVYVTNETSGDLTIIDATKNTALATIPLGKRPRGIAASPDRRFLYVALSGSPVAGPGVDESKLPPPDRSADGIGVVDIAQRKLVRVLESGTDPEQVAVSADGRHLFVANEDAAVMSVVDPTSGKVLRTYKVGEEPEGVSVHPSNGQVYVTSEDAGAVFVVDPSAERVLASIEVGPRPRSIAFLPDGSKAYVTNENGASLTVIDTVKLVVARTIDLGTGMRPMGAVASPDGAFVYRVDRTQPDGADHRRAHRRRRRLGRSGHAAVGDRHLTGRKDDLHRQRSVERCVGGRRLVAKGDQQDSGGARPLGHHRGRSGTIVVSRPLQTQNCNRRLRLRNPDSPVWRSDGRSCRQFARFDLARSLF